MITHKRHVRFALAATLLSASIAVSPGQILEIDVEQHVLYIEDVADNARFAIDPGVTTRVPSRNFNRTIFIGDIVAVNSKPVKGVWIQRTNTLLLRTNPSPGQAIADLSRDWLVEQVWELLQEDGTPIGTIMAAGLNAGQPVPGAPSAATAANLAITGGTGAFLGARGQISQGRHPEAMPARAASVTEDPSNRRLHGGGKTRFIIQLIPLSQPEIMTTQTGPAVLRADFTPVTEARPARPGEILILMAKGLGPIRPGVDPGQRFPENPLHEVNSPIAVTVNGLPAEVINKIGWPGTTDRYRVDMRLPDTISSGPVTLRLRAAWVSSPEIQIPFAKQQ